MPISDVIAKHYACNGLLDTISHGLERIGKTTETVTIDDLAPVDEFHIGGSLATRHFLDSLAIAESDHILDIGCGIGGASRFAASSYGCQVTGIDLTPEFIETGNELCSWVGLKDHVDLVVGNALDIEFPNESFDHAYFLHVGMNVADKTLMVREAYRVLRPGGMLGIYDVMQTNADELLFPVPWAHCADSSWLAPPEEYKQALASAGFELIKTNDRRSFAIEFFDRIVAQSVAHNSLPPLGLHLLMGESTATKVRNMIENISLGRISPMELIAQKPG